MVSSYPTSTNLLRFDGLSTNPRDLGHHIKKILLKKILVLSKILEHCLELKRVEIC